MAPLKAIKREKVPPSTSGFSKQKSSVPSKQATTGQNNSSSSKLAGNHVLQKMKQQEKPPESLLNLLDNLSVQPRPANRQPISKIKAMKDAPLSNSRHDRKPPSQDLPRESSGEHKPVIKVRGGERKPAASSDLDYFRNMIYETRDKLDEREMIDLLAKVYLKSSSVEKEHSRSRDSHKHRSKAKKSSKKRVSSDEDGSDNTASTEEADSSSSTPSPRRRRHHRKHPVKVETETRDDHDSREYPVSHPPSVHPLTIAEQKRLQWEREREEQAQLRDYNPWGKPGAGAPPDSFLGSKPANMRTSAPSSTLETKERSSKTRPPDNGRRQSLEESTGISMYLSTHEAEKKRQTEEARHKWLTELDAQRKEKEQRHSSHSVQQHSNDVPAAPIPGNTAPFSRGRGLADLDERAQQESELRRQRMREHQEAIRMQMEEQQRQKAEQRAKELREEMEAEQRYKRDCELLQEQQNKDRNPYGGEDRRVAKLNLGEDASTTVSTVSPPNLLRHVKPAAPSTNGQSARYDHKPSTSRDQHHVLPTSRLRVAAAHNDVPWATPSPRSRLLAAAVAPVGHELKDEAIQTDYELLQGLLQSKQSTHTVVPLNSTFTGASLKKMAQPSTQQAEVELGRTHDLTEDMTWGAPPAPLNSIATGTGGKTSLRKKVPPVEVSKSHVRNSNNSKAPPRGGITKATTRTVTVAGNKSALPRKIIRKPPAGDAESSGPAKEPPPVKVPIAKSKVPTPSENENNRGSRLPLQQKNGTAAPKPTVNNSNPQKSTPRSNESYRATNGTVLSRPTVQQPTTMTHSAFQPLKPPDSDSEQQAMVMRHLSTLRQGLRMKQDELKASISMTEHIS